MCLKTETGRISFEQHLKWVKSELNVSYKWVERATFQRFSIRYLNLFSEIVTWKSLLNHSSLAHRPPSVPSSSWTSIKCSTQLHNRYNTGSEWIHTWLQGANAHLTDNKQKTWEKTSTGGECTTDKQRDHTWDRRTPATILSFTLAFSHNVAISECTHDSTNITLFDVNQHHTLVTTRPIDGAGDNTQDSTRWMPKPNERAGTRARHVLHTQRSYKV
jgi:hypothetical protein